MEISHTHRFLFVHVPKTGGTTIAEALAPHAETLHPNPALTLLHALPVPLPVPRLAWFEQHDYAARIRWKLTPALWDRYLTFTCVRNPFDHAISHYEFARRLRYPKVRRRMADMSFEDCLAWRLSERRPERLSRVWRFARLPDQAFFACDREGRLLVNRVLKTETLREDLPRLLTDLGLPPPPAIGHARRSKRRREGSAYLTPRAVELIRELYARDFDLFGYERDVPERLR
jgi:hypothetical protein